MLPLYSSTEFSDASLDDKLPLQCLMCGKIFYKTKREILRVTRNPDSRTKMDFCCRSCSAQYLNLFYRHRSKFELFLEDYFIQNLPEYLPNLPMVFNCRDLFDEPHEVDLYFPTIKVAVEINGRHHYEPIHGMDRFNETIKNDNAVASCCYEQGILLVVFNTSEMGHFSMQKGEQYAKPLLDIIVGLHAEYEQYNKTASA